MLKSNGLCFLHEFLILMYFGGVLLAECYLVSYRTMERADGICEALVRPYRNYDCQEFMAETRDGYLLGVQRVSAKAFADNRDLPTIVVFHGIIQGGDSWFLNPPGEGLGFVLADAGYHVWIANFRTTDFSYGHVSLPKKGKAYWDWSVDEIAACDLPAILELVHTLSSNNCKPHLLAYSQGSQTTLAAFSNGVGRDMVDKVVFVAPIAYISRAPLIVNIAAKVDLAKVLLPLGIHHLITRGPGGRQDVDFICKVAAVKCYHDWFRLFTGYICCINNTRRALLDKYETQGTSVKNLLHFTQQIQRGSFAKYDYGMMGNLIRYGWPNPPSYDVSKIANISGQKMLIIHSDRDSYSNPTDVAHLLNKLPLGSYQDHSITNFGHMDFVYGSNANHIAYDTILRFLKTS